MQNLSLIQKAFLTTTLTLSISACNLTGFMDKPSGDIQLLDAARSCLDRGDYDCALEYYQQISGFNDQKTSEISLTNLANANLFKMTDLFETIGSGTGSNTSFTSMAQVLASRGKTSGADRLVIQKAYADAASITDTTLRAYIRFIASMTMMNQILANGVGADGVLTASDIASNPTNCSTSLCTTAGEIAKCTKPASSELSDTGAISEPTGLSSSTNWESAATVKKAIIAATDANSASNELFGASSDNGLGSVFGSILQDSPTTDCAYRKALINALFN